MMRIAFLGGCLAVACLATVPLANAQGTNLEPGDNGPETTCPQFMALEESAQIELLGQIHTAMATTANAGPVVDEESQAQAVTEACASDDKLTVGQALEQIEPKP